MAAAKSQEDPHLRGQLFGASRGKETYAIGSESENVLTIASLGQAHRSKVLGRKREQSHGAAGVGAESKASRCQRLIFRSIAGID